MRWGGRKRKRKWWGEREGQTWRTKRIRKGVAGGRTCVKGGEEAKVGGMG